MMTSVKSRQLPDVVVRIKKMIRIDGYPLVPIQSDTMLQLSDLSIAASTDVLRLIATFLMMMAEEIETGRLRNSHIHIGSRIPEWSKVGDDIDIQVINPNYEGPAIMVGADPHNDL
jgi:ribonucleotide reductase alpha subunit